MDVKCPGSDMRNITADEVVCPSCGARVELFSDEQRRRCPSCGARVTRDATPACAAWCPAAAACLGTERYEALKAAGLLSDPADPKPER